MMNAGVSPAGRGFAIRNSDLHFDDLHFGNCANPEDASDRIKETKRLARELGREIQVWIPVSVVCRPARKRSMNICAGAWNMPTGKRWST